jgi:hypothetical protein
MPIKRPASTAANNVDIETKRPRSPERTDTPSPRLDPLDPTPFPHPEMHLEHESHLPTMWKSTGQGIGGWVD